MSKEVSKKIPLLLIALLACSPQIFPQKAKTIWGDTFTGNVVATNDSSREITLMFSGKGKAESFTGVLKEGYQVKMKDGSFHELKVSELHPSTRIRVYYKETAKNLNGRKVIINIISRIEFLGRDEFAQMRQLLNIDQSTPVTEIEFDTLPEADPLKIKLVSDDPTLVEEFAQWAKEWNRHEAKKYGKVEFVSESAQANIVLAMHRGSDSLAATMVPMVSAFLLIEKPDGFDVLWKRRFAQLELSVPTKEWTSYITLTEKEIEQRLKARYKRR